MCVVNSSQQESKISGLNNEDLMVSYGQGDYQAFEELYNRNKAPLYRYFLRQLKHSALAEEFSHEVWLRIIKSRESYFPKAKFTTYLFQIAHNRIIDHFRQSSKENLINIEDHNDLQIPAGDAGNPESKLDSDRGKQQLITLINLLPGEQREVFLLKEEGGLSIEDIANVVGENAETIKSRMRYAVKKLKEGMLQYFNGYQDE